LCILLLSLLMVKHSVDSDLPQRVCLWRFLARILLPRRQ
jgi:hypothetical protein